MNKVDAMRPNQTLQMSDSPQRLLLLTIACWRGYHVQIGGNMYDIALIEKMLDEGLSKTEVNWILNLVEGEVIPFEVQGESSVAMGFISVSHAETVNYDYATIEENIQFILNDVNNETSNGEYEVLNGFGDVTRIWMNRSHLNDEEVA